jgi:hypothetical protein
MEADDARTYVIMDDVLAVDMDEEWIALGLNAGHYFGVRGAMRHLMADLRDGMTRHAMVARLCALYDVTPEAAAGDIDRMLPRLIDAQLVRQVDAV